MALIPPFFMDSVVALGADDDEGQRNWIASGFLYGKVAEADDKEETIRVFLVTNSHVLSGLDRVWLRCNPEVDEPAKEYSLGLIDSKGMSMWTMCSSENIDIAVTPMDYNRLKSEGMQVSYFRSDLHAAGSETMAEIGLTEGDSCFVLGFPMGFVGRKRNTVMVRSGVIASIRDCIQGRDQEYLVDANVFPGNSGGPVVSRPQAQSIRGTTGQDKAYLIGVVRAYVPYHDTAISQQTGRTRIIFEENAALAAVHTVDCIDNTIREYEEQLRLEL